MKNWNQPVCRTCWDDEHPYRHPVVVPPGVGDASELCCYCGAETRHGIYVRVDPATVKFPTP